MTVALRYLARLSPFHRGPAATYGVYAVAEDEDGERVNVPIPVIEGMTTEQATHLWRELGNALGMEASDVAGR